MKGGARARAGSAPNMRALNRDRDWRTFTRLPQECSLPVPDWPLEVVDPSVAELALWDRIWHKPQAHVWHADHLTDQVALYVRMYLEAAGRRASGQLRAEVRQREAALLLDVGSLTRERYVIVDSPEDEILQGIRSAQSVAASRPGPAGRSSARSRMKVVPNQGPAEPDDNDEAEPDDA